MALIHRLKLWFVFLIGSFTLNSSSFGTEVDSNSVNGPPTISIKEAIDREWIELKISGAANPRMFYEVVDKDGVHYGKCMAIILKSKIDSLYLLQLNCGTELIPFDTSFQTMIVTKTVQLPLYPNETYATRFYAMCGEINDAPPYIESKYMIGDLSDTNVVKLTEYFDKHFIQNMIGQHALWAYTDEASLSELSKYGADSSSIQLTKEILNQVGIKTKLVEIDTTITNAEYSEKIEVSRYVVYSAAFVIAILLIATTVFIIRSA